MTELHIYFTSLQDIYHHFCTCGYLLNVMYNRYQGEALHSVESRHSNRKEDRHCMHGCGNANGLSREQCPVATGLVTPTMMNHSFPTAVQTMSWLEWIVYTVIKRRIGGGTSTAAEPVDIAQSIATGQITSTTGMVIWITEHPIPGFLLEPSATTVIRRSKSLQFCYFTKSCSKFSCHR